MDITPEQLQRVLQHAGSRAYVFCDPLNEAMAEFGISTGHEVASFIAQIGEESRHLQVLEENLNYSAEALLRIWPKHFDQASAPQYAHHPEMIANRAYANRYGNGDEDTGDGWRYRGRGAIQVTFLANYVKCADALHLALVTRPELLIEPGNAVRSAAWFWKVHGLNAVADDDDARAETRIVNGGLLGLADRQAILDLGLKEWA